jgi:hypothetical protein
VRRLRRPGLRPRVRRHVALGYKNAPRCVPCLAKGFDRDAAGFLADVRGHVARRACLQAGWEWASANGGTLDG